MQLVKGGETLFRAELRDRRFFAARTVSQRRRRLGRHRLPAGAEKDKARQGKWFSAKLSGDTRTYPFLPGEDVVTIRPTKEDGVLQALSDSRFVGREWIVRENARHAKSKTYRRSDVASRTPTPGN